jgi:hypothetical protein
MMVVQGMHAVHVHPEAVAEQARETIHSRAALVSPYIARAKAAAEAGG